MKNNQYKVLNYNDNYVDEDLLTLGIYVKPNPKLHSPELNIDGFIESYENNHTGLTRDELNTAISNIKKCYLTLVELSVVK